MAFITQYPGVGLLNYPRAGATDLCEHNERHPRFDTHEMWRQELRGYALSKFCPAELHIPAAHGDTNAFPLTYQHDEALAAREAGVEEIAGQHRPVLHDKRDHNGGVFRALRLMDGRGVLDAEELGRELDEVGYRQGAAPLVGADLQRE